MLLTKDVQSLGHKKFTAVINYVMQKTRVFNKPCKKVTEKTKTLAYYTTEFMMAVKSFMIQPPVVAYTKESTIWQTKNGSFSVQTV